MEVKRVSIFLLVLIGYLLLSALACEAASTVSPEKGLQVLFEQSRAIIKRMEEKLRAGSSIGAEITELKGLSEEMRSSHLL